MRTRERLVEVLGTIGEAAGPAPYLMFNMAADVLSGDFTAEELLRLMLQRIDDRDPSPHIRELAAEALHYLRELKP